jgi:hypothetical protein
VKIYYFQLALGLLQCNHTWWNNIMQEVVSSLVEAQAQGVGGVIRSVPIGEGLPVISSFVLCVLWSFHPSKH